MWRDGFGRPTGRVQSLAPGRSVPPRSTGGVRSECDNAIPLCRRRLKQQHIASLQQETAEANGSAEDRLLSRQALRHACVDVLLAAFSPEEAEASIPQAPGRLADQPLPALRLRSAAQKGWSSTDDDEADLRAVGVRPAGLVLIAAILLIIALAVLIRAIASAEAEVLKGESDCAGTADAAADRHVKGPWARVDPGATAL